MIRDRRQPFSLTSPCKVSGESLLLSQSAPLHPYRGHVLKSSHSAHDIHAKFTHCLGDCVCDMWLVVHFRDSLKRPVMSVWLKFTYLFLLSLSAEFEERTCHRVNGVQMEKANDAHLQQEKFSRFDNASKNQATVMLATETAAPCQSLDYFGNICMAWMVWKRDHRELAAHSSLYLPSVSTPWH